MMSSYSGVAARTMHTTMLNVCRIDELSKFTTAHERVLHVTYPCEYERGAARSEDVRPPCVNQRCRIHRIMLEHVLGLWRGMNAHCDDLYCVYRQGVGVDLGDGVHLPLRRVEAFQPRCDFHEGHRVQNYEPTHQNIIESCAPSPLLCSEESECGCSCSAGKNTPGHRLPRRISHLS